MPDQPKGKSRLSRRDMLRAMAAGGASASLVGGYANAGTQWLSVERRDINLARWDADGFRVGLISDVHLDTREDLKIATKAARIAMAERPDVLAVPGDFVNQSDDAQMRLLREFLRVLDEAPCPVFATLGNHDYWTRAPRKVIEEFEIAKVRLLRNEAADVDGVTVYGVDDAIAGRHRPGEIVAGRHSKSLLALFHEPDFVEEMPEHVSLQLSGHSHGGQICLPFGVAMHTPRGARRYIDGYFPEARVPLFVSRGVGTVGIRLRLFCRPQVAILTLRST